MVQMPSAINKVSGTRPMPSTWMTGASAKTASAHSPASRFAPGSRMATWKMPQALSSHSVPGSARSNHTGAPDATSGHWTQPTSGGWSK